MSRCSRGRLSVVLFAVLSLYACGDDQGPAATGASTTPTTASLGGAYLRVANLSADLARAELRVDGATWRPMMPYPEVTRYRLVEPGSHRVRFRPAGEVDERTVQLDTVATVAAGHAVTVVAAGLVGTRTLRLASFDDEIVTPGEGARLRLVNGMSDFPARLALWLNRDTPVLRNVAFLEDRGYRAVDRGNHPLEVRRQGTPGPLVPVVQYGLAGRATYTMFAYGTLRQSDLGALLVLDGSLNAPALRR